MNLDAIANIATAVVAVTMVTAIVTAPNTAQVIKASGDAFSGALRASLGK